MISVIIPTMWRSDRGIFYAQLAKLQNHHYVGEVILIDNSDYLLELPDEWNKIYHIKEGFNTFVNPAWNKGVQRALYDKLLIMNDDVALDYDIITMVYPHITPEFGMIGAGKSCWHPHYKDGLEVELNTIDHRPMCYGSFFFIHKQSYNMIPEDIKIWYGDDWLFQTSGKPNFEITNWEIRGESSQTVNSIEDVNPLLEKDRLHFERHMALDRIKK